MSKLSARWITRMLTPDQKLNILEISKELLALSFSLIQSIFLWELWPRMRHGYIILILNKNKEQAKEIQKGIICWQSVFLACEGVLDYLQKGQTINGEYYASILRQIKGTINSKRQGKLRAGVLLLQDNIPGQHKWQPQNRKDVALNCCPIHLTLQSVHHQTSTYSPYWNPTYRVAVLRVTLTSHVLLKVVLGLVLQSSSEKGSESLTIGCQCALMFRGIWKII